MTKKTQKLEEEILHLKKMITRYEKASGFLMITALFLLLMGLFQYSLVIFSLIFLANYIIINHYSRIHEKESKLINLKIEALL